MSGRDRCIKNNLDDDVRRILNSDTKFRGKGMKKLSSLQTQSISTLELKYLSD